MPASKIVNEDEVVRWIKEGRTYQWMTEEYSRRYNIETSPTMWSNFRRRRGLDRRIARDDELLPWAVLPKHRHTYPARMLRAEARRRAGFSLNDMDEKYLPGWIAQLEANNEVVYYDAGLPEGFVFVPREPTDTDIVRLPQPAGATKRRNAQ